jgi:hypothetical protein
MEHVGGCHPHGVNVVRFDSFAPVGHGSLESEVLDRAFATLFFGVSTHHQDGVKGAFGE